MSFGRFDRHRAVAAARRARAMADINVTPLVDVVLVLLVLFMVAAPLVASRLRVDVPALAGATPPTASARTQAPPVTLTLDAAGALHWNDEPIDGAALKRRLADAARRDATQEILLRADRRVPYGDVASVLDAIQAAGLTRLGFIGDRRPQPFP